MSPIVCVKVIALPNDLEIKGHLKCARDLVFEGRLEGEVHSGGTLTVGNGGQIKGNITARSLIVFGKVGGNVTAQERCVLGDSAIIIGDITAPRLSVEAGAVLMGQCKTGKQ